MEIGQSVKVKECLAVGAVDTNRSILSPKYITGILRKINQTSELCEVQTHGGGYIYCHLSSLEIYERRKVLRRKHDTVGIS